MASSSPARFSSTSMGPSSADIKVPRRANKNGKESDERVIRVDRSVPARPLSERRVANNPAEQDEKLRVHYAAFAEVRYSSYFQSSLLWEKYNYRPVQVRSMLGEFDADLATALQCVEDARNFGASCPAGDPSEEVTYTLLHHDHCCFHHEMR